MAKRAEIASDIVLSGRYRLCERLGSGGMGEVWEAEDAVLGRRVALKLVKDAHLRDDTVLPRFRREAQSAAGLTHPNLATVFDYGETDESVYLVMELLRGETLGERLQRGPLPPDEAATVVAEAADGLAAAHRSGIVHRDVKPSNLMLTPGGVKVMDFGIATSLGGETITATGLVVGTASYLAPERVRGEKSGPEADVYGLGAVLYEALTGERAFEGGTMAETAMAHLHREVSDLTDLDPSIPPALAQACRAALAKDPSARPAAAELAAQLRNLDAGPAPATGEATSVFPATVPERPPPVAEPTPPEPRRPTRTDQPPDRRPWLLAAVVLALLALAGAAFLLTRAAGDDDQAGQTAGSAEESTATSTPEGDGEAAPAPEASSGGDLESAAVGYVEALDSGNFEEAWSLTSPEFQGAQDRDSWEGFWGGFDSVELAGDPQVDEEAGTVTLPLSFDGRTENYELVFIQGPDGTWLVDGPVGS